jgi:hypothetical protein
MNVKDRFHRDMNIAHSEAAGALSMIVGAMCEDDADNPILALGAAAKLEDAARTIRERVAVAADRAAQSKSLALAERREEIKSSRQP